MKPSRLNPACPASRTGPVAVFTRSTSGMKTATRSSRFVVTKPVPNTVLSRTPARGCGRTSRTPRRQSASAVVVVLVLQRDEHLVEQRVAHAVDLHERTFAERLAVWPSRMRDGSDAYTDAVDADAGLRAEERALVVEARQ